MLALAAGRVAGDCVSEKPSTEDVAISGSSGGLSRRTAIRLGLFMAGASTVAWTEPGLSTITLAHGAQASPLCIESDAEEDTDDGRDSEGGDDSDDSDSHDDSEECDDSDDSDEDN
jgi:hypothetical protein